MRRCAAFSSEIQNAEDAGRRALIKANRNKCSSGSVTNTVVRSCSFAPCDLCTVLPAVLKNAS